MQNIITLGIPLQCQAIGNILLITDNTRSNICIAAYIVCIYIIANFTSNDIPLHNSGLRCIKANFSLDITICNVFGSIINLMETILGDDVKRQWGYCTSNRLSVGIIRRRSTQPITFCLACRIVGQLIIAQILRHLSDRIAQGMIARILNCITIYICIDTTILARIRHFYFTAIQRRIGHQFHCPIIIQNIRRCVIHFILPLPFCFQVRKFNRINLSFFITFRIICILFYEIICGIGIQIAFNVIIKRICCMIITY